MIARVASFRFPTVRHRDEAERNGSERVGPSLAAQPGFQAIYYGRIADLEALSISVFDSLDDADAAAATMNAQPLLRGQTPDLLPTPESVTFYEVAGSIVHDRVPLVGRLGHVKLIAGVDVATADRWFAAFASMLDVVPGLAQAFLLVSPSSDDRIALTLWIGRDAMEAGGAAIRSWHEAEAAAGRPPAAVGTEERVLSDLRVAIVGVPTTMPATPASW